MTTKSCNVCGKTEGFVPQSCGRCKARVFCGPECQRSDWPSHKATCNAKRAKERKWQDRHRLCEDGSSHFGEIELITWEGEDYDGQQYGWGGTVEDPEGLKRKFEKEFRGDKGKFYDYWPSGFRWTCCGTIGDMKYGCDHHGTGPRPCTCDFCHMGKPLPDRLYSKETITRKGLTLSRGPDPRSFNHAKAAIADTARTILGMDSEA
ncbi:hypothetical protein BT63DRAFT_377316 [Microthyrium microscopicum]|uniref:MYND-type domain-containing protein n=1 Tax=Microthyrium microscopicum TaxID=703497 RepID=A0A6A6U2F9_9PEZI|nr:hypothetical protein BT63DRAFT_377316 [Microthyrium microscopicum]